MRKYSLLVLVVLLLIGPMAGLWPMQAAAAPYVFSKGNGTTIPYLVLTPEDMDHVRDDLGANYKQGADIDLSSYAAGTGWVPIGTPSTPFTGTFDGDHYTITGLAMHTSSSYAGLFGKTLGSTLKNVQLENVDVIGTDYLGGLVGWAENTIITDSSVSGSVTSSGDYVGGLAGYLTGTDASIRNSYAAVDVSGAYYVGGLLGTMDPLTVEIESSYATGDVTGTSFAGGLAGISHGSILNSYATGDVHATSERVGGLTAYQYNNVHNSFETGAVTGGIGQPGSLIGYYLPSGGTIADSFYNITINSLPAVGDGDPGSGYLGLSDSAMRTETAYGGGLDFTSTWGINENYSYPYLRVFAPVVRVDGLAQTNYLPNSPLIVNGRMSDGSLGEAVSVDYAILDHSNLTVTSGTYGFPAATGFSQGFSIPVTLDSAHFPDGQYTLNVTAADASGNHTSAEPLTFNVDHLKPIITLNGPNPMHVEAGDDFTDPGATAQDEADGDLSSQITVEGAVYSQQIGMYTLLYNVADQAGYQASEAARTVQVSDTTPPVITLVGESTMTIGQGTPFTDPGATAMDSYEGNVSSQITVTGDVYNETAGTYTLVYKAQDSSGNAAVDVVRTVNVEAPVNSPRRVHSNNADLAKLNVAADGKLLELSPAFTPETTEYTAETEAEQVELQLIPSDSRAVVKLLSKPVEDTAIVQMAKGINVIAITVQAENGTLKTYTVRILRNAIETGEDEPPAVPLCTFKDIQHHWAKSDICEAARLGIVEGVNAQTFDPNSKVTRTAFAVMLLRTLEYPISQESAALPFSDNDSIPEWARPAIQTAAAKGIVSGYLDGTFRPQQAIKRQEMAAMIAKAMKWKAGNAQHVSFSDETRIPAWAQPYVDAVYEHGLLQGRDNNQFVPEGITTRAEAAVISLRLWKTLHEPEPARDSERW